jgi:excisionase family DNA binding protein
MQTDELITVKELAEKLKVQVSWIYQRTRLGQEAIPFVKMGKYLRFNLTEVIKFYKENPQLTGCRKPL